MARILLLIGGHLWTSPRSQKEADALSAAGHDVSIAGVWLDEVGAQRDRAVMRRKPWGFEPLVDLRHGGARSAWLRLRSRAAREIYSRWGRCLPDVLGYGPAVFLGYAKKFAADLTIVHSEAGLWVGSRLLDRGYRVGVDFEDWFSRDLLPDALAARPVAWLEELERRLARHCVYSVTTSRAMANAIAAEYSVAAPEVLYNMFPQADAVAHGAAARDRRVMELPSAHWFSQTIGPGRGLEWLFQAAQNIELPFEIHLRGTLRGDAEHWLRALVPAALREQVFIHDTVSSNELPARIEEHDIGLALETSAIRSRDLTVTNKLFQYLQGGLAVIASDTAGQREIFTQTPDIGILIPNNDAHALEVALRTLLIDREKLKRAKAAARAASDTQYVWERQRPAVQALAARALGANA